MSDAINSEVIEFVPNPEHFDFEPVAMPAVEQSKKRLNTIKPDMSYPGKDLDAWKVGAREKLRSLLGMNQFEKVAPELEIVYEKKVEGATEIRFTFRSEDEYRVPCHLFLPDGVENPPVIICLQGHSRGMHVSMGRPKYEKDIKSIEGGDRDFCVRAVKEGFAAIAMEQRSFGECGGNEKGPRCHVSSMIALMMGRTTIAERVWDISRLIDVLEESFADKVDVKKICCMGNSGGGTATAYAAALEDRIVLAMPSSAMCTFRDSIGAMKHCVCNYVPNIAFHFDMGDLMAMACPKYFVQVNGVEDKIFPIAGAEEVFEAGKRAYAELGCEDRVAMIHGDGGHRFYADAAWPVVHKYLG